MVVSHYVKKVRSKLAKLYHVHCYESLTWANICVTGRHYHEWNLPPHSNYWIPFASIQSSYHYQLFSPILFIQVSLVFNFFLTNVAMSLIIMSRHTVVAQENGGCKNYVSILTGPTTSMQLSNISDSVGFLLFSWNL